MLLSQKLLVFVRSVSEPQAALEMLTPYSFACIPMTKYSYQVEWKSTFSEMEVGVGDNTNSIGMS